MKSCVSFSLRQYMYISFSPLAARIWSDFRLPYSCAILESLFIKMDLIGDERVGKGKRAALMILQRREKKSFSYSSPLYTFVFRMKRTALKRQMKSSVGTFWNYPRLFLIKPRLDKECDFFVAHEKSLISFYRYSSSVPTQSAHAIGGILLLQRVHA